MINKFEVNWLEDRSNEAVLDEIRRVAALNPGRRLTVRVFDSVARIKSTAIRERFGSWSEATRRAGLSDALPVYSKEEIIEDIKRVSDLIQNEPFTIELYQNLGRYSASTIKRYFEGWQLALTQAGLSDLYAGPEVTDRMKSQIGRAISDSEIIDEICKISERLGKESLSGADIEANSDISQSMMYRRFGSVSAALKRAGVKQVKHGKRYTEVQLFENLIAVWTHYGRAPSALEMDRPPSLAGQNAYIHRYGGWRKALRAFVEFANSETEAGQLVATDVHPADLNANGKTSAIVGGISKGKEVGDTLSVTHPRAAKPPRHIVPPEERRQPSIGLRFRVMQRDNFKCVLCGDHPARNVECVLHLDHIIPWSKEGRTTEDNLRTLCATCNIGRGNRFLN
jgi:hypothetical protein